MKVKAKRERDFYSSSYNTLVEKEKIALSWSGGKDSSLSLYELVKDGRFTIEYLLTTVTKDYDRISMHGVRRELLEQQSKSVSIGVDIAYIPKNSTNEIYESVMEGKVKKYKEEGIMKVAFGDIFLRDIREYREDRMSRIGMDCVFPIWGRDTREISDNFIKLGFKAIICTVDPRKLSVDFAGKEYDEEFLFSLPEEVDPCGENGEFHSFVYDGPIFKFPISVKKGEVVLRDNFYFADLFI